MVYMPWRKFHVPRWSMGLGVESGFSAPDRNFHRIHFCLPFWNPGAPDAATNLEYQAQIIIHETSHIYYNTADKGMGPGRAECIAQFVADANNSPTRPGFIGQCGPSNP